MLQRSFRKLFCVKAFKKCCLRLRSSAFWKRLNYDKTTQTKHVKNTAKKLILRSGQTLNRQIELVPKAISSANYMHLTIHCSVINTKTHTDIVAICMGYVCVMHMMRHVRIAE